MSINQEIAERALQWIENTEAFLTREFPIYIQEIITYYSAIAVVWSFLSLVILITTAIFGVKAIKDSYKDGTPIEDMESAYFQVFAYFVLGTTSLIILVFNLSRFLKITLAPRLFIIEYFSEML